MIIHKLIKGHFDCKSTELFIRYLKMENILSDRLKRNCSPSLSAQLPQLHPLNSDKFNWKKNKTKKKTSVFIKAPVVCISEYTQIPVSVCFCGPQRKYCMCVCDCQVRLEHLCCDVSHLIMAPRFLLSPLCAANVCDACMSVRA